MNRMDNGDFIEMCKNSLLGPKDEKTDSFLSAFSGMYKAAALKDMKNPVLLTSCKGVGKKLDIAIAMSKFDTIGIDCVALCANDILRKGGKPLFFTYFISYAPGKQEVVGEIIKGIEEGCRLAGITELNGEASESSIDHETDNLSVAGFLVGAADEENMITGETIKSGNSVIGIASSGLHTEGFAKVRRAVGSANTGVLNTYFDNLGCTFGEELIKPSRIYTEAVNNITNANIKIRGMANVSKGSFLQCIKETLPEDVYAEISLSSFAHPPIFQMIQETGGFSIESMYEEFNMGIGMLVIVAAQDRDNALQAIRHAGETAFVVGSIKEGRKGIEFVD